MCPLVVDTCSLSTALASSILCLLSASLPVKLQMYAKVECINGTPTHRPKWNALMVHPHEGQSGMHQWYTNMPDLPASQRQKHRFNQKRSLATALLEDVPNNMTCDKQRQVFWASRWGEHWSCLWRPRGSKMQFQGWFILHQTAADGWLDNDFHTPSNGLV